MLDPAYVVPVMGTPAVRFSTCVTLKQTKIGVIGWFLLVTLCLPLPWSGYCGLTAPTNRIKSCGLLDRLRKQTSNIQTSHRPN